VLADGSVVRTDAEHEPELFWALRGGGGNFGVVTELRFRTYDIATAFAGMLPGTGRRPSASSRAGPGGRPRRPTRSRRRSA
jgi:hypothetical protein